MVFGLELGLEDMKKRIGWDDSDQKVYREYSDRSFLSGEEGIYYAINAIWRKGNPEQLFPFRVIFEFDSGEGQVNRSVDKVDKYYVHLFKNGLFSEEPSNCFFTVLSEASTNTYCHGGAKEDGFVTYECFHASPEKTILKISNPSAKEWDYRNLVNRYISYKEKKRLGETVERPPVRCGFSTFEQISFPISYADGGRTFLALLELED